MIHVPKKPSADQLSYLREHYCYTPETGQFFWLTEGGKGASKHYAGDECVGRFGGGYRKLYCGGRYVNASHAAYWFVHGEWPAKTVDHINRDPLDNRAANLRLADMFVQSDNRTGWNAANLPKGVQVRGSRFRAYKKGKHLGVFDTVSDAAAAYEAAHV